MKKISFIVSLFLTFLFLANESNAQVSFRIQKLPTGSYKASMKSVTSYAGTLSQISNSFQFTVLVVTGSGAIQNLTSLIALGSGVTKAPSFSFKRSNAPTTNPSKDYVFFNLINLSQFDIAANKEIDLFSFDVAGACLGDLELFVNGTTPASQGLNSGNNISIVGASPDNQYINNYGGSAACSTGCNIKAGILSRL